MGHCTSNTAKKQQRTQTQIKHEPNIMNDVSFKCINNSIEINTSPSFFFIFLILCSTILGKSYSIIFSAGIIFDSSYILVPFFISL